MLNLILSLITVGQIKITPYIKMHKVNKYNENFVSFPLRYAKCLMTEGLLIMKPQLKVGPLHILSWWPQHPLCLFYPFINPRGSSSPSSTPPSASISWSAGWSSGGDHTGKELQVHLKNNTQLTNRGHSETVRGYTVTGDSVRLSWLWGSC